MAARFLTLGWLVVGLMAGAPLGWWLRPSVAPSDRHEPVARSSAPATAPTEPPAGRRGPWGLLDAQRVLIEPPVDAVRPEDCGQNPPQWRFRGYTAEAFDALMGAAGVGDAERRGLREHLACFPEGCIVTPTMDIVLGLAPEVRALIYRELAAEVTNRHVLFGFRCPADSLDDWLSSSGLDGAMVARFNRLTYHEGPLVRMSDAWALCAAASTPNERIRVAMTLARTPALLVHVHIPPGADLETIRSYWGVDGVARDARSLLDSVSRAPGTGLDLMDLLPPLAREKLNTFPRPGPRYDCFWTSLNFFATTPDDRYLQEGVPARVLVEEYTHVTFSDVSQLGYGDLVAFYGRDGQLQHVAVHIADDVMFTKNGVGDWNPWVLTKMSDLRAIYGVFPRVEAYRKRSP